MKNKIFCTNSGDLHKVIFKIITFIVLLFISDIYADDSFNPVNSTVKTGDQKYNVHVHKRNSTVKMIFNAPVSAGYFLIRCFQVAISPQDGPSCRFYPTCSTYGKEAVIRHGILAGSFLAGERLLRCNPYNPGGEDPVPEEIFEK